MAPSDGAASAGARTDLVALPGNGAAAAAAFETLLGEVVPAIKAAIALGFGVVVAAAAAAAAGGVVRRRERVAEPPILAPARRANEEDEDEDELAGAGEFGTEL